MAGGVAMCCRPQGYPSPHLIVLIRYHSTLPIGEVLCHFGNCSKGAVRALEVGLCWIRSTPPNPMILLTLPHHGCVYTLSQEDGDELYYAPVYADGSVNLHEFAPVDLDAADMDEMELFDIRNRLNAMCQV